MNGRLLVFAFASQIFAWTGAALFLPIIPIYLRFLNATDVEIGHYSAIILVSLSFGPVALGWVSDRWHLRDRLVVGCLAIQVPVCWLMGTTDKLWVACFLNTLLWTFGASAISLTRAIVALNFATDQRDRAFARLAIASPASFVIGGLAGGRIVEAWGYPGLFKTMTVFWMLAMLAALGICDRHRVQAQDDTDIDTSSMGKPLLLFCAAMMFQSFSFQWSEIAFPLRLSDIGLSLTFITSMHSVSSLASIPIVLIAGRYAGRVGNVNLLFGGLVVFALCRLGLSVVEAKTHVIGLQVVTGLPAAFSHSIASAVIAGLGPARSLGSRMSLLMMCGGVGGALGGVVGGYLLEGYGPAGLIAFSGIGFMFTGMYLKLFVVDPTRDSSTRAV